LRIKLIDFDSKIPNLALMKLSAWHKQKGDVVGFDIEDPDKVYVSLIFTKSKPQAAGLVKMYPDSMVTFGGSGWDLKNFLPDGIEFIKPDYDLYPSTYSQGFTTRGCIRKCPFCIVPEKEGKLKEWWHPSEFHDDRFDTCMIMDNNLLGASKTWIESVFNWFIENKIKMLSPQGWDARLLTEEYAAMLKGVKHANGLRFAWDNIGDEKHIERAVKLLISSGFRGRDLSFYVLVGFNSTFEQDVYRCNKLKEWGVCSYVMRYHKNDPKLNALARWSNARKLYWSHDFSEYKRGTFK